eukprot:TRINITY_DN18456_c0_g1_i2.p3 TRINITY_DN18456_c0_g1~~TRINITY_DN18456_c0_g1_i2.p3  ORF type:complete len:127 (+),score=10.75 TRINITY_DN18456_c0_g1_i2:41-382(+)
MIGEMAPEKYYPCRWLDPVAKQKGTFYPYGMGARTCLGLHLAQLEMKLFLANVVYRYEWEMVNNSNNWTTDAIKKPKDGLPLRFRPRDRQNQSKRPCNMIVQRSRGGMMNVQL